MTLKSGSLGTLLQGVSQQPDRVRLDGQVTEQINLRSDVTSGLSTRPATEAVANLPGADAGMRFDDIRFNGNNYIVGYRAGVFDMWLLDGTQQNVVLTGTSSTYVGDEMTLHVVDKQLVVLNRETVVQKDALSADGPIENTEAMVQALGGQFSNTYEVSITFTPLVGGAEIDVLASYTAPDGDAIGDAAATSADFITQQLADDILANVLTPVDVTVTVEAEVLLINSPTHSMKVTTKDGEGGTILRSVVNDVKDIEDLPRYAPNGHVVLVVNSEVEEDDYWLKFDADDVTVEDGSAGFGEEGVWREWYNPEQPREFDLSTMPHVVEDIGGTLTMSQGPWIGRPVGDDTTSPFASVVDKPIKDIDGFEGRLAMITPNTVVMSRTDTPFDLWRESATVKVATDPIDFTSTKKDELKLDWIVPFDRDLIIVADPGDSQFIIRGGELSSDNAGMVLTTEFQVESQNARPVSTGRTILLPFVVGRFSGVKEFYTNSDNQANAADSLTETQDRYITGRLSHMAVSQNFNLGLFKTDQDEETVWVYEYLYDRAEALQSAWHKWSFKDKVSHFFFDNSIVYFVSYDELGTVFTHRLDLNRPLNAYGFHTMLDRNQELVVTGQRVNLPYRDAAFMQSTDAKFPGIEVAAKFELIQPDQTVDYIFDINDIEDGMSVVCGQRVEWEVSPTQVFGKDFQNRVDTSKRVTVQDYVVHVFETGVFSVVGTSPYSGGWEYNSYDLTLDDDPIDPDGLGLTTGPIVFPWGERADYSSLKIKGNDIRPFTMHELAWVGQVLKSRGRRS